MPDYKTGSYLLKGTKPWLCQTCSKPIVVAERCFARIMEHGPELKRWDGQLYRNKTYTRWHLECALQLDNLNQFEHNLLGEYFKTAKPTQETNIAPKVG